MAQITVLVNLMKSHKLFQLLIKKLLQVNFSILSYPQKSVILLVKVIPFVLRIV